MSRLLILGVGGALASLFLDPVSDGSNVANEGNGYAPTPGGSSFSTIDDAVRQPTAPNTTDYISSEGNGDLVSAECNIGFNNLPAATSSLKVWVYHEASNFDNVFVDLVVNGTPQGQTDIGGNVAAGWQSVTFVGPFSAGVTLAVQFTINLSTGGGPVSYSTKESALYIERIP